MFVCIKFLEISSYPTLKFREAVDLIWPYIKSFSTEYNQEASEFTFAWAIPTIDYSQISLGNEYHNTLKQKKLLNTLHKERIYLKVPKKYFAKYTAENFNYYPSRKVTEHMSDCVETNYKTSLWPLNELLIKPGEIFNLNQAISRIPGYCTKINGYKKLPFYGGACGTAGQLFRTALLTPEMTVTKRYPHVRWWAQFYGKTIFGDDAAVLTMDKQLEIRNDGTFPIYYKTLSFENYTYLVAISPIKTNKLTTITKNQTWPLSATLTKTVVDRSRQEFKKVQTFFSRYYQYFTGGT